MSQPTKRESPCGVVNQATAQVAALSDAAERVEMRLASRSGSADEVAGISSAIEAIASQTSLLALNAAIAAAQAAGNGLAVVAGEVTALAGQTRQATLKIGTTVHALSAADRAPRR